MSEQPRRFPIGLDRVAHGRTVQAPKRRTSTEVSNTLTEPTPLPASSPAAGSAAAALRLRMVRRLEAITDLAPSVMRAMESIPREPFVDAALAGQAYEDTALPIGHGQTISKPSMVARMLSLLTEGANARAAGHLGRCLEIGTGGGYQAALLSLLAPTVLSIERLKALHDQARESLADIAAVRRSALRLVLGDGRLGHPPNAPYDSIIAAAVGEALPEAWMEQLAVGGRLVSPVSEGGMQSLVVVDRTPQGLVRTLHEPVRFVPLESGVVR